MVQDMHSINGGKVTYHNDNEYKNNLNAFIIFANCARKD